MDEARKQDVLDALDLGDRLAIQKSLDYAEDSAGRMMQRDLVAAPAFWTVGQTIDMMRARDDLPEDFYEIIVVDPSHRPLGTVPLSRVMGSRRPATLDGIMIKDFRSFSVTDEQEDVAYAFNQYHLVSAPVVDENGRLAGVITIDDAMQALDEETEEDLLRLGGVGDEDLSGHGAGDRAAATAVAGDQPRDRDHRLDDHRAVRQGDRDASCALAVLMTIVASMGGNAGTQTLTVAVRALATERPDADQRDADHLARGDGGPFERHRLRHRGDGRHDLVVVRRCQPRRGAGRGNGHQHARSRRWPVSWCRMGLEKVGADPALASARVRDDGDRCGRFLRVSRTGGGGLVVATSKCDVSHTLYH